MAKNKKKSAKKIIKPKKSDKINIAAQRAAMEFLESIYDGYDQDIKPLYGTSVAHLQADSVRELIPVISDTNVNQLQQLLVKFYTRNVTLELQ